MFFIFILGALLLSSTNLFAQTDTTSSDGLFQAARHAAFDEKDYNKAKQLSLKALGISPDYADIKIFLGRLYSWTKGYDSAKICFSQVLAAKPDCEDASLALADVQYWNDDNADALKTIDDALKYHASSTDLLIRKAKVLAAMQSYKQADSLVNVLLKQNKNNTDALSLANNIRNNIALNKIGVAYDYVGFNKSFPSNDPWHLASLSYTRQSKAGSFTARVNYANRFKENGLQYEIEAYPRISKTFYSYVEAGYSDNVGVFPQWRGGLSLYANLPKSFEAEAGWRYLYFSAPTNILTAYLGKYYKNYLFALRTYFTPGGSGLSQSYNLFTRYYFGNANDYLELLVGTGISPDERSISQLIANNLKTYKASLEFKHEINTVNIISFNASIINQELLSGLKGNQFQVGIGYQRRFK